ncbi:MAG TPA: ABC transporter permease [Candidatus Limnocylindrales bacterium]|nr:ABC transporter permease [Candidatus Limnocylindrales bacterium]
MAAAVPTTPPPRIRWRDNLAAAFEHELLLYRRTWRGSVFGNFLTPVLFLLAMGIGLGTYVNDTGSAALGGVTYLQFLAPGLLAGTLMQTASFESSFPVLSGFNWTRRYHAMNAAPMSPAAIAIGHLLWTAARLLFVGSVFTLVMTLFGAAVSPLVVLAIPAAALSGMAFAAPITALMATQRNPDRFFYLFRFAITPMFLFSGTFFPIEQLPEALRPLAWLAPLWHGVDLCRALALGTVGDAPLVHVAHVGILGAIVVAGTLVSIRLFARRLQR